MWRAVVCRMKHVFFFFLFSSPSNFVTRTANGTENKTELVMWFYRFFMACVHIHTCSQSHLTQVPTDPPESYTTVERVNIGYKGNNIQLQCWHIKERRWKKRTVKNIKIDRIKSEDIVADIKDTILHCQPFKVRAPLFFDSFKHFFFMCNFEMHQRKKTSC